MKKVKMIEVYNSVSALNKILEMKMPVKTSMKFVSIIKEINLHLAEAEKIRNNLLEKHGKKDKTGGYNVPDSKKKDFINELNTTLLETEVEIRSELLTNNDFDDSFSISPGDLSLMQFVMQ